MVKLVAIYTEPQDIQAFETHYKEVHTPLIRKMPSVRKLELNRFTGAPMGAARYYLMAEIYFDNRDDMMASLNSPEGQAAGKDIMSFAGKQIHMMFADVQEV